MTKSPILHKPIPADLSQLIVHPKDQVTRLICSKDSSSWQGTVRSLAWIMWTSRAVVYYCEGNRILSTIYHTTTLGKYTVSLIHYCKASNAVPKNDKQGSGQSAIKAGIWSRLASANPSLDVPQDCSCPTLDPPSAEVYDSTVVSSRPSIGPKKYYRTGIWMLRTCFVYS